MFEARRFQVESWRAGGEIGIGGGEAAEIVFAEKGCGDGIQASEINRPGVRIDIAREKRRTDLVDSGLDGENAVLVGFGDGGVAGVKCVGHDLRFEDADGSGQGAIEGANEIGGRDARLKGEAGDLGKRVHAGVGAAGALGQRRLADDAPESRLQFALDGGFAGLDLPAVEVGAVVGESQFPRLHFVATSVCGRSDHGNQSGKQGR